MTDEELLDAIEAKTLLQSVQHPQPGAPENQTFPQQTRAMKCPTCNAWTLILETRIDENNNQVWRRRECGNFHTFATLESHAGSIPRPTNKRLVAVRPSRSKGVELDAPVYRRIKDRND